MGMIRKRLDLLSSVSEVSQWPKALSQHCPGTEVTEVCDGQMVRAHYVIICICMSTIPHKALSSQHVRVQHA